MSIRVVRYKVILFVLVNNMQYYNDRNTDSKHGVKVTSLTT